MQHEEADAADLIMQIHRIVRMRADHILSAAGESSASVSVFGRQDHKRTSALARLQAYEEVITTLRRAADSEVEIALAAHASYAEVGAACRISRQAARKRHQRLQAEQERRREARRRERAQRADDDWDLLDDDWPPRPWRFRAPTGLRTVQLLEGPANSQTFRVAVGDDAFPFVGHRTVFGRSFVCHARYSPRTHDSDRYYFTGEYYLR